MKSRPLIGAHLSIQGGVSRAVDRADALGITVLQLFTHNPRQWDPPSPAPEEADLFCKKAAASGLLTSAHSSYLINLASGSKEICCKSAALMVKELRNAAALAIPRLVLHPGSIGDANETDGIAAFTRALDQAIGRAGESTTIVALETTAGHGRGIGHRFGHLRDIIGASRYPERLGVCLDTCHVFASGYDIGTPEGYDTTIVAFDKIIGLEKIVLFHINDSRQPCGKQRDRHQHIGLGHIGLQTFARLLADERFADTGKCLETPKGKKEEWDPVNIGILRSLADTHGTEEARKIMETAFMDVPV